MTTSALGVWTPGDSDDWDLTIDLAAMANSIDTVLLSRYQRSSATAAGLGTGLFNGQTAWVTGTNPGLYFWNGTAWIRSYAPFAMESGVGTFNTALAPGQSGTTGTIAFSSGRFTVAPILQFTPINGRLTIAPATVSAASFTASMNNWSTGGSAAPTTFNWTAIQMLPTSAAG